MTSNLRKNGREDVEFWGALLSPEIYCGWYDSFLSRAYRAEYDRWAELRQVRYELGRRMAAVYRGTGAKMGIAADSTYIRRLKKVRRLGTFYNLCIAESKRWKKRAIRTKGAKKR